jgi:hypothetical protein
MKPWTEWREVKHSHYFDGVARCETRHRLEAYATVRRRVVALGAQNSPQKAFRQIARHSGEHCSIGFQPVSGFGSETGLNPNGTFPYENRPKLPTYLRQPYDSESIHYFRRYCR